MPQPSKPPPSVREARAALLETWTRRLEAEFDHLARLYRVGLRRPRLSLEPLGNRWGSWDPLSRTLRISTDLVEKHPWDAVLEILRHEMAHQLVSDVYGVDAAHGTHFAHACRVLRVADWARRASGPIPDNLETVQERQLSPQEERLLRRAEKLLSLASSSNEHEALLAMQRVQELYARHHLERLRERAQANLLSRRIYLKKKRVDRLDSTLASILIEHFFVRAIFGYLYDAQDQCDYRTIELLGTRENVPMALYVYHFLRDKLAELWTEYQEKTGARAGQRQDFMLGVLVGFRKKLTAEREQVLTQAGGDLTPSECRALMRQGDQELERFVDHLHPRLTNRYYSTGFRDASSYTDGIEEGGRIVLNRPIEEGPASRGRLLKA